jgi:hypothetical protein
LNLPRVIKKIKNKNNNNATRSATAMRAECHSTAAWQQRKLQQQCRNVAATQAIAATPQRCSNATTLQQRKL